MYNSIGYLSEERGLHPKMTVEEELTYLATLKGLSSKEIRQRIDYWLERFAITENRKADSVTLKGKSTENPITCEYAS